MHLTNLTVLSLPDTAVKIPTKIPKQLIESHNIRAADRLKINIKKDMHACSFRR